MCLAVAKAHLALLRKALEDGRGPTSWCSEVPQFPQWIGWENLRIHHTTIGSLAAGEGSTSHPGQWNSETKLWLTRAQHDGRAHGQILQEVTMINSLDDYWLLDVSLEYDSWLHDLHVCFELPVSIVFVTTATDRNCQAKNSGHKKELQSPCL